jgi:hypothetical protein
MQRAHYEPEWKAFLENARRFDDNPPEHRYGIINPSADPPFTEADMLYSDCPRKLHDLHYDRFPTIAVRNLVDFIENTGG